MMHYHYIINLSLCANDQMRLDNNIHVEISFQLIIIVWLGTSGHCFVCNISRLNATKQIILTHMRQ